MKLNKELISMILVIGLIGYIGLAKVSNAESNKKARTLQEWGVPSIEGLDTIKTLWKDCTDKLPGKETKYGYYKVDKELVATYSINVNGKDLIFAVSYDKDLREPLDLCLTDKNGDKLFSNTDIYKKIIAPQWVIDKALNYKKK